MNLFFKLFVTCALILWFVHSSDVTKIYSEISSFSPIAFCILLVIQLLAFLINNFKWRILLPQYSFWHLFQTGLIGRFYSFILPGQIAGEAVKIYLLGRGGKNAEKITASVFVDKITGVFGLLFVGCIGLLFTRISLPPLLVVVYCTATIAGFFAFFSIGINLFFENVCKGLNKIKRKYTKSVFIIDKMLVFINSWRGYVQNYRIIITTIILGVVFQVLSVLIYLLCAKEIGLTISFFDWSWIFGIVATVVLVPITIAGIGLREGALIGVLGFIGISKESALAVSFSIMAIQIMYGLVGYLLDITRKREIKYCQ